MAKKKIKKEIYYFYSVGKTKKEGNNKTEE